MKPMPFVAVYLIALGLGLCNPAHSEITPEVAAELKALREQLQQVRAELDNLRRAPPPAAALATSPAAVVPPAVAPALAESAPAPAALSFFGYGEMDYSRPRGDASQATATVRRGVLGWSYRFDERTRFAAELELENAVVSADDKGEIELEQFYLEHDLSDKLSAKAGLFLLPVGYLNEVHEPTRYFGVSRNRVETAIIPSTWRELGLGLRGITDSGLRWDAGVVTSFDLTKWDAASTDGQDSPLGAIHQEGQLAKARNLAAYAALNYNGRPGLNLGGSLFTGGVGHKQAGFAAPNASLSLAEVHARWQPGRWDLSALAAWGRFSQVSALNATLAGQASPVPGRFDGAYLQAAYRLWSQGNYALLPFARYERLNTARSYPGLEASLAPAIAADTRLWTAGASLYLNPQVVLKMDVQKYLNDSSLDRFNLGLGFHF